MSNASNALIVFAKIHPKVEYFDDTRMSLEVLVPITLAESGCRQFTLHEDFNGGGCLYLYEEFESELALEAHYAQDYTMRVIANYEEWLARPVDVTKMRIVESDSCD